MGKKSEQKKGPQPPPEPIQEPISPVIQETETQSHAETGDKPKYRPLTPEIFAEICDRMADGSSVVEICDDLQVQRRDFYKMVSRDENASQLHARARREQALAWVDDMREIANDSGKDLHGFTKGGQPIMNQEFVARSRLRIDTLHIMLKSFLPTIFGNKQEVTVQAGDSMQSLVQRLRGDGGAGSGALPVVEVGAEVATRSRAHLVEVAQ